MNCDKYQAQPVNKGYATTAKVKMKLHNLISAKLPEAAERVQSIGKALSPSLISELKLADIKKTTKKEEPDLVQQMRDYAVDQMENSTHSAHIHRKIRHYD